MALLDKIVSRLSFHRGEKALTLKNPQLAFITDQLLGTLGDSIAGREYAASIWVYRAVNIWSSASACPMKAHRAALRKGDPEPVDLPFIFRNPNPDQTFEDVLAESLQHLGLYGHSLWMLDDGNYTTGREPITLRVVSPKYLKVEREDIDYLGRIARWTLNVDGRMRRIDPASIVCVKLPSPYKAGMWQSPIDALRETVDADYSARRHNKFLTSQHGRIPGVVSYDDDLTADELKRRSRLFHELYGNSEAAGKWLHVVKTKIQQLSMSSKDMDWEAGLKLTREEICAAYNIPPVMAGILDKATYSNFEQADKALVESCFIPLLRKYESASNMLTARSGMERIKLAFDVENHYQALQESEGLRIDKYTKLVDKGVSPEQAAIIADLDLGEITDAHKTVWMPAAMVPVSGPMVEASGDSVAAVPGASAPVQDQALNGSQIESLLSIIEAISLGTLTVDGAVALLVVAFPTISEEEARKIVAGAIKQEPPDPPASPPPEPPQGKSSDGADGARVEALRSAVWRAQMQRRLPFERKMQKAVKKFLFDQRASALAALEVMIAEAKSTGSKSWKTKAVPSAQEIANTLLDAGWDKELVERMSPILLAAGTSAAARLLEDLKLSSDKFSESAIANLIRQHAELLPRVNESTRDALTKSAQTLVDAVGSGVSIDDAAETLRNDVRAVFSGSEARATTIARTEIGRAMEGARHEQLKGAGVATKVWISSRDSEVRDLHKSIDGEEVPVDQPFSNGLMYPMDPAGSAAQTVNCRCTSEAGAFE